MCRIVGTTAPLWRAEVSSQVRLPTLPSPARTGSGEEVLHHLRFGVHAGELHVNALPLDGELAMVDAELVENGGVEVANVDGVLDDVVAEIIGLAIDGAALDTGAGEW